LDDGVGNTFVFSLCGNILAPLSVRNILPSFHHRQGKQFWTLGWRGSRCCQRGRHSKEAQPVSGCTGSHSCMVIKFAELEIAFGHDPIVDTHIHSAQAPQRQKPDQIQLGVSDNAGGVRCCREGICAVDSVQTVFIRRELIRVWLLHRIATRNACRYCQQ